MTTRPGASDFRGFFAFYREYARSGVHAAAAAGMTLFGLLATFEPKFVVPAIGVYVLPPLYLYLSADGDRAVDSDERDSTSSAESPPASESTPESESESEPETDARTESDTTGETETPGTDPGWVVAESPTDEPLYDAVIAGKTVFAVGDNGIVLACRDDAWEIALERGPTTESNPLWGVDATSDGEHVWFGGDSGVLGQYDAEGKLTDHSAPRGLTDSWEDVACVGPAGDEEIYLVNGSGEVLRGRNDAGDVTWAEPTKPGSGSSLSGICFRDREVGYCCDTSQGVFETTDGGTSWERIGIDDAGVDFNDLSVARKALFIAGGDGSVFRHDDPGWTKLYAGEETIFAIDRAEGNTGEGDGDDARTDSRSGGADIALAVGDNGAIYEQAGNDWERVDSPTDETLCGVVVSIERSEEGSPAIAVGDDGTILERGR